jgi:hypothetical protein
VEHVFKGIFLFFFPLSSFHSSADWRSRQKRIHEGKHGKACTLWLHREISAATCFNE